MKFKLILLYTVLLVHGCTDQIKNDSESVVQEIGTQLDSISSNDSAASISVLESADLVPALEFDSLAFESTESDFIDTSAQEFWVGDFKPHKSIEMREKVVAEDDGLYWGRENKISISIDQVIGDSIVGHSVGHSMAQEKILTGLLGTLLESQEIINMTGFLSFESTGATKGIVIEITKKLKLWKVSGKRTMTLT